MLKKFLPTQENFFNLFQKSADLINTASSSFHDMLNHLNQVEHYVESIANSETEGDQITHQIFELLHKTFITPFDRHDIHHLATGLDDILDLINRCAQRFPFYHLETIPNETIELAKLSRDACQVLNKAVYELKSLKHSQEILKLCNEIDPIESQAHQVVLAGESALFLNENDFKQFFKLNDIYSRTKLVINRTQDVANMIKGIVLEYS